MKNERAAKIVATIGPVSDNEIIIRQLILAGMNVARLNFSHGDYSSHSNVYHLIRRISQELGKSVCIMQDLQGPKVRIGKISGDEVVIAANQTLTLTPHPILGNQEMISVDFPGFLSNAQPGKHILLDDGNVELEIMNIQGDRVITSVIQGGVLKSHKGISIPGSKLMVKGFTEKDHEDLLFGLQLGVDALAISFVRQPEDIHHVRQIIAEHYPDALDTLIVSKLERPEALENLEAIIEASDGVMVARGDLGVELSPEIVPIAQKEIISLANKKGKFVITATQMLESMIHHARPTRAEASDVANAIFDGTDTVMLSGETAVGNYPIHSVKMMEAIIRKAEVHIHKWGRKIEESLSLADQDDTYFITRAARELAHDRNVTAIAAFTKSGRTALMLSKARPDVPIFALTPDIRAYQRMSLYWGVFPILTPMANSMEDVIMVVEKTLINNYYVNPGDQVILVCGFPIQAIRKTNLTLLYTIGEQTSMEK